MDRPSHFAVPGLGMSRRCLVASRQRRLSSQRLQIKTALFGDLSCAEEQGNPDRPSVRFDRSNRHDNVARTDRLWRVALPVRIAMARIGLQC